MTVVSEAHTIQSSTAVWLELHVMEKRPLNVPDNGVPVLLVHGATIGGSVLYDIPGSSWLDHLACGGRRAFALDVRGFGASSRPPALAVAPQESSPAVRAAEAVEDIADAVDRVLALTGSARVDLIGGSWGSVTAARYAIQYPEHVRTLSLYAPVFAPSAGPEVLAWLADPADPGRLNPKLGAWRLVTPEDTIARWRIELEQSGGIAQWRPEIAQALAKHWANNAGATAIKVPNGPLADAFDMTRGVEPYDPSAIACPCLLVRGEVDQASTHSDAYRIFQRLGAKMKRYVEIGGASHFAMGEAQAQHLFDATLSFVDAN